jgi:thiol:disulfide interchange protein DsbA
MFLPKIKSVFLVSFLFLISFSALSVDEKYTEGEHYSVLAGYKSPRPELREFFSLYCPACASLERFMFDIKTGMPDGMTFSRSHVNFLGGVSKETQDELSRAYVFAGADEKGESFVTFMFKRIHSEKNIPKTPKDVESALVSFGYSEKEAKKGMSNMVMSMQHQAMRSEQYILIEEGLLKGVPSLMVNNKYMIKTSSLDKNDPIGDLSNLISYLNEMK